MSIVTEANTIQLAIKLLKYISETEEKTEMSDDITLELSKRDTTGKAVKHLRKDGVVPAVIHDHGKESVVVQGEYMALTKAVQKAGKHHPVTVKANGKNYLALIKSVDLDPKKNTLRHVVFNAVKANEKVDAEVPVKAQYAEGNESTPAERASLVVLEQLETVEVEALPKNLPDALYYDAEMLVKVGDQVTVADLIPVEGVTVTSDPSQPLATVFEPSALQAANDAAGGDAEDDSATAEDAAEEATAGESEADSPKAE